MILANVRSQLTREDASLALALIAQHGTEARDRSADCGDEHSEDRECEARHISAQSKHTRSAGRAGLDGTLTRAFTTQMMQT